MQGLVGLLVLGPFTEVACSTTVKLNSQGIGDAVTSPAPKSELSPCLMMDQLHMLSIRPNNTTNNREVLVHAFSADHEPEHVLTGTTGAYAYLAHHLPALAAGPPRASGSLRIDSPSKGNKLHLFTDSWRSTSCDLILQRCRCCRLEKALRSVHKNTESRLVAVTLKCFSIS